MKLREIIREAVAEFALGKEFTVEHPADEKMGDYSTNIAMVLAKELKRNPRELAVDLVNKLQLNKELVKIIEKIEPAGPGFINFWINDEYLWNEVVEASDGETYGKGNWGKGQKWVVEHTSPNPNKAMHVGHLRNNLTGMALGNLFEAGDVEVIRDAVDNNRGIAIAKLMWGYLLYGRKDEEECKDINFWYQHQDLWASPEEKVMRPDLMVDSYYVKGQTSFEESKENEMRVRKIVVDWEAGDVVTWALWKKVLEYSYEGQEATLKRLKSKWDYVWHEHEHYKEGKEWVEKGLKEGVFTTLPDGAILTNLSKYGLTDTIARKSDGTALYITQDLALTNLKVQKYKADRLLWVIGPEQSLDMKQMFATCEMLGIGKMDDFTHVAYGYMTLKGLGKMSSRMGNVVFIDQLLDIVKEEMVKKLEDRNMPDTQKDDTAEKLTLGAVKYAILKVGRLTDMDFDLENSISFDGDSGPYLNYVYVRCLSLIGRSVLDDKAELGNPDEAEKSIMRWIYRYPEIVETAGKEMSPNLVCSYLLELAKRFNSFYARDKVQGSGNKEMGRLVMTKTVAEIIKAGLSLLGIDVVEKM